MLSMVKKFEFGNDSTRPEGKNIFSDDCLV